MRGYSGHQHLCCRAWACVAIRVPEFKCREGKFCTGKEVWLDWCVGDEPAIMRMWLAHNWFWGCFVVVGLLVHMGAKRHALSCFNPTASLNASVELSKHRQVPVACRSCSRDAAMVNHIDSTCKAWYSLQFRGGMVTV